MNSRAYILRFSASPRRCLWCWLLSALSLAAGALAASAQESAPSEGDPRAALEQALIAWRLRELGLSLAREAYTVHAATFESQPAKRAVVEKYLATALAEQEIRASGEARQPPRPSANPLSATPAETLWLHDTKDKKDIEYSLYDPSLFAIRLAERTLAVRAAAEKADADPAASVLLLAWCDLLDDRPQAAWKRCEVALAAADTSSSALWIEWLMLAWVAGKQMGLPPDQLVLIQARTNDLGGTTLWAMRAASLSPAVSAANLSLAQNMVRELAGDQSPLARPLLNPRDDASRAAADMLRGLYWEIAWAYRSRHVAERGLSLPIVDLPALDAVRARQLVTGLDSVRVAPADARRTLLEVVMLADIGSRAGEFELWQNNLTPEFEAEEPLLTVARHFSRILAAESRIAGGRKLYDLADAFKSEDLPELLTGTSEPVGEVVIEPPQFASNWPSLAIWLSAGGLAGVLLLVVGIRILRSSR